MPSGLRDAAKPPRFILPDGRACATALRTCCASSIRGRLLADRLQLCRERLAPSRTLPSPDVSRPVSVDRVVVCPNASEAALAFTPLPSIFAARATAPALGPFTPLLARAILLAVRTACGLPSLTISGMPRAS